MEAAKKHEMTGAFVWFLLLIVLVPSWYENPVAKQQHLAVQGSAVSTYQVVPEPIYINAPKQQDSESAMASAQQSYVAEQIEKQAQVDVQAPAEKAPEKPAEGGQWIVRLASFSDKAKALETIAYAKLHGYDLDIKAFQNNTVFSVRTKQYSDVDQAKSDQEKLIKLLNLHDSNLLAVE